MATKDPFSGVIAFLRVAEERSYRRAAERLRVTTPAVSKAISRLEADLGVQLVQRSSRHVALTAAGQLFQAQAQAAVATLLNARQAAQQARKEPQGELVVTLPLLLGSLFTAGISSLAQLHPNVVFRLIITDRFVRLNEDNVQVAVRIGELQDSALVSKKLRTLRWVTVASPSYLARRGVPKTPDRLAGHNCLRFVLPSGVTREWEFATAGGAPRSVRTEGNLLTDDGRQLIQAAIAGMGICQVFDFIAEEAVRSGQLTEILAPHAASGPTVWALCAPGQRSSANVRMFFDLATRVLGRP